MHETKQFESNNKWFKLNHPASWQVELEDGIYTFTEAHDPNWAFQISAYRANHDSIPDFDINKELQHIVETHSTARIVTLSDRKAIYYTEFSSPSLLHIWIIGGKRCKAFCTYTVDSPVLQNANFKAAQQAVNSVKIQ